VHITMAQLLHGTKDLLKLSEMVAKKHASLTPVEVSAGPPRLRRCSPGSSSTAAGAWGRPGAAARRCLGARRRGSAAVVHRGAPCPPCPACPGVCSAHRRGQPRRRRPAPAV
jgi:hypothetical protein